MASRLRVPPRASLPLQRGCSHAVWHARGFTSAARLHASKPAARPPTQTAFRVRTQRPSQPSSSSSSSSSSSASSAEAAQTLDVLFQQRKWPLVGAGLAALALGLYISTVVTSTLRSDNKTTTTTITTKSPPPSGWCTCTSSDPHEQPAPTGLPASLATADAGDDPASGGHVSARAFDKGLDLPERLMGITSLRRELAARARGHVLEVAVGTGRNLAFYDWSGVVAEGAREGGADADADAAARAERERERLRRLLDRFRPGGPTVREQLREQRERGESEEGEVLSFTGVDLSGDMLGVARDRMREAVPGLRRMMRRRRAEPMPRAAAGDGEGTVVVDALGGRVRLVLGDALRGLPSPAAARKEKEDKEGEGDDDDNKRAGSGRAAPDKYDTVIQTFGLCSVADPARLLANMAARVRPDTGRIILLEHGRGWYEWINRKLDEYAPRHFEKYGCWWNRDIEQLVRDAARAVPGLEVVKLERPLLLQAGTTLLIELRVKSQQAGGGGGDGKE